VDLEVATELIESKRIHHGLFFAHLALEKLIKAFVYRESKDHPPKIHNLVKLANLAKLELTSEQRSLLADTNLFHIEGRYPEYLPPPPSMDEAVRYLNNISELFQCLKKRL